VCVCVCVCVSVCVCVCLYCWGPLCVDNEPINHAACSSQLNPSIKKTNYDYPHWLAHGTGPRCLGPIKGEVVRGVIVAHTIWSVRADHRGERGAFCLGAEPSALKFSKGGETSVQQVRLCVHHSGRPMQGDIKPMWCHGYRVLCRMHIRQYIYTKSKLWRLKME